MHLALYIKVTHVSFFNIFGFFVQNLIGVQVTRAPVIMFESDLKSDEA